MALQSSGAISLSQIKTELGSSANDFRTLHAAAGFSTPDSISEFYGYSAATEYQFYVSDDGGGFGSFSDACSDASNPLTLFSSSTSLAVDVTLFKDRELTDPLNGGGLWFKSGSSVFEIKDGGKISARRGC